jgi:dUTP pyrophosphatase
MNIRIRRIDQTLTLPRHESAGAVGFDFVTRETTTIQPGCIALVPGNVVVQVPSGYALLVVPRSSLPRKKALVCPHSIGVIDQDYCGPDDEILIQVQSISNTEITVERGERIAQGIFVKVEQADWEEVDDHGAVSRGGFGSTGTHVEEKKEEVVTLQR